MRGALLSSDDKKRVILDSDQSLEGTESVRMLGTSFFQDMTGASKKMAISKVYDQAAMTMENETLGEHDDFAHTADHEGVHEDDKLETLVQEGDDEAIFVADFESAASELAQSDSDLSAAFTTYVEARRKLGEKFRARGFFPISKDKSKGFGKGKSKFKASWSSRRSLQQRIMNSNCRLRGRQGHWKSECPNRSQSGGSSSTSAPVTLSVGVTSSDDKDIMPDEFLLLPEVIPEAHSRDSVAETEMCCVKTVLFQGSTLLHIHHCTESHVTTARDRIRNFILRVIGLRILG